MRRRLKSLVILAGFLASIRAEFTAMELNEEIENPGQYGIVYFLDLQNNRGKSGNLAEEDGLRDFKKLPENGLLLVRLLPKSMLENEDYAKEMRSKRSPGGGGCSVCGGGGPGGGYGGGPGGGYGGGPGGGYGGGPGFGSGGVGRSGAWSSSSSGAYAKGFGKR